MSSSEQQPLSSSMTVLSMVNGMIGGFILILPVLALQTGYMSTAITIIITGVFSYYSCYLCVEHIGNEPDLDVAIYKHFAKSNKIKYLYEICVWSSLLLIDFLYFELIIIQWIGLAPPHQYTITNAIINAFLLFGITMTMKYFQFGANLMAYGVISIISYLFFLTWVVGSQQTNTTHAEYKAFGSGIVQLAAGMGQAFAIQSFFIPILRMSQGSKNGHKLVLISYIIGGLAYIYIAFMGSYGILYRDYMGYSDNQRTIQGYFGIGTWEVNMIELIYLMHLYSVFPEFLLISKKRLFGVLNYPNTPKGRFNLQEIFYIALAVGVCLVITLLRMSIRDIIDLNGAFIGCIFIYILPAVLHIRCLYYGKGKMPISSTNQKKSEEEEHNKYDVMIEQNILELEKKEKNRSCEENHEENVRVETPDKVNGNMNQIELKQLQKQDKKSSQQSITTYECNCKIEDYTKSERMITIVMVACMVSLGVFIMINGLIDLTQ